MQSMIDINNEHRNRQLAQDEAIRKWLEAADHIKSIDQEQYRQSNQLRDQTDQLKAHNQSLDKLNAQLENEAKAREQEDRRNRRFTFAMCFMTAALTLVVDNIATIIKWVNSLF